MAIAALGIAVIGSTAIAGAQSAVDGFDPGANSAVNVVAVQSDGTILVGGTFARLGGGGGGMATRNAIGRLYADGSLDGTFNPGANGPVQAIAVQADGAILVGGSFTTLGADGSGSTARNGLGRLFADGSVDNNFNPGTNGTVYSVVVQPDGKILVAGDFTLVGVASFAPTTRNHIARLNADGTLDVAFDPGADGVVNCLVLQADGKIVVGGQFTGLGGGAAATPRSKVGRLNADGSVDTSFDPGANGKVRALVVQADGRIVLGGEFDTVGGGGSGTTTRNRIARLNRDGTLDLTFDPGASGAVDSMAVQADGKIVVGGSFFGLGGGTGTIPRNRIGRINTDGGVDLSFDPGVGGDVLSLAVQLDTRILVGGAFGSMGQGSSTQRLNIGRVYADGSLDVPLNPDANGSVYAVSLQPDGKMVIGGAFSTLGGRSSLVVRAHLARLGLDGTVDPTFAPGANDNVFAAVTQPDGKILVGGAFTLMGGGASGTTVRNRFGRLNADGSLDLSFDPNLNGTVHAIALQPDGKILVGGEFTMVMGFIPRARIARFNADGTLDTDFNPGVDGIVQALAVQPDGAVVVGGLFATLGGSVRLNIGRVDATGALDPNFDPGANGEVGTLALQWDGAILIGGLFSGLGGGTGTTVRHNIGRVSPDGVVDDGFDPGANNFVTAIAVQADERIVVGGGFTLLGGGGVGTSTRNFIGRLTPKGALDADFDPGANDNVFALALEFDGKVVAAGDFLTLGGGGTGQTARSRIGRIATIEPALQEVLAEPHGSAVGWARAGTGPEVSSTTFEVSTDGINYTMLGPGARFVADSIGYGFWVLYGQSLPLNQHFLIKARGYYSTGFENGSGSVVEAIQSFFLTSAPLVVTNPASPIGSTTATLNGTANPNGLATTGNFEYGPTVQYGSSTPLQVLGSGTAAVPIVGGAMTGLACATVYHFRATATNLAGTVPGEDATFTTLPCPLPFVTAEAASGVFARGATLHGSANPNGGATMGYFQYGVTSAYGSATSMVPLGSGSAVMPIGGGQIVGLTCNTLYHFRAVATNSGGTTFGPDATFTTAASPCASTTGDFDGDSKTDLTVWRPTDTTWYWLSSSNGYDYAGANARRWPSPTFVRPNDIPLMGDIDGDGKADLIVWEPGSGTWSWLTSGSGYDVNAAGSKQWGNASEGDIPLVGDIDGDGKADLIVWRASTGTWFWLTSSSGYDYAVQGSKQWGNRDEGDIPRIGDLDGDHKADLVVWRASIGTWFWLTSSTGYNYAAQSQKQWGTRDEGDTPLLGDIDGDGKADLVVWRATTGTWYSLMSSGGYDYSVQGTKQWGNQGEGDVPLLGNIDGDGQADLIVWRRSTGSWYWLISSSGYDYAAAGGKQWGSSTEGDIPLVQ